jgi:tRNA G10  N-methylase Trm11
VKRWSVTSKLIRVNTVRPNLIFGERVRERERERERRKKQRKKEKPHGTMNHEED